MHIIDSHFHWWPRSISERLCRRKNYPRAEPNDIGGYTYLRQDGGDYVLKSWADWFDAPPGRTINYKVTLTQ